MATQLRTVENTTDSLDGMSLPGWLYFDPEFFDAEKNAFLRQAPQVVCHDNDIATSGEWRSLDYLGESVIVIRGDEGEARAFANDGTLRSGGGAVSLGRATGDRAGDASAWSTPPSRPPSAISTCSSAGPA